MGLSYWIPLHGTGNWDSMNSPEKCSTYRVRSTMGPAFQLSAFPMDPHGKEYPWEWFRKMGAEYLRARPSFAGNYYPLTEPAGVQADRWAVYQMHRPDLGEGFVMAFRRKSAPWEHGLFALRELEPAARYEVEDADTGRREIRTGRELAAGLEITLTEPESSALVFYKKL